MTTNKAIMGSFRTFDHACAAISRLESHGVAPEKIGLIAPEQVRDHLTRIDRKSKAPEGAAIGGATGVALGALAAGLTAVASIAVPGVGLLAAGPLAAALAGAGAGGAAGGAIGGLVGLGLTEHEARFHTSVLKNGGYVVSVSSDEPREQKAAREVLSQLGEKSESTTGTLGLV